ncbi:MAG: tRNA lysidine(34) synthetase TilS [Alphaproteobacteria bacterium]|nr:tRNA lysidine(34) synthetase TilS [Alphaproteobacteria bacterium]
MSGAAHPIGAEEFAAKIDALGAPRRVVLAVSGGPDSMALARLAAAAGMGARALAVTVDHGLRPESRAEAEQAGAWCRAAGLEHRILFWRGEKPETGVQAAARQARYRLLAGLAAREGYDAILTGHTADDQAETAFMRLARGAGPAGLAAMRAERRVAAGAEAPVRLLRPLLDFARARIDATLAAFGQARIDDPSNDEPGFERVRTRALIAALEEGGLLTREALLRAAARARAAADRLGAQDRALFDAAGGVFHRLGWARLDRAGAAPASLLTRLIHAAGAGEFAPSRADAAEALAQALARGRATLGGALLIREGGGLLIAREPAALLGRAGVAPLAPVEIAPGGRALWDRRFILENRGERPVRICAFGERPGPWRALYGAPPEAMAAAPAVLAASGPALADGWPGLRAVCLLAERFDGAVLRFS